MAEAIKLWKSDADGPYIDLLVGQKKDISLDLTDYWPAAETLISAGAVWSVPTGVTLTGNVVSGLLAKGYLKGITAGEYDCLLTVTSESGSYIEPFHFKVIVR